MIAMLDVKQEIVFCFMEKFHQKRNAPKAGFSSGVFCFGAADKN